MNLWKFGDRYVIEGEFDRILLRPLNSMCQVLFESFNLEALGSLLLGILVIVYTSLNLSIDFNLIDYLWLFLSSISGAVILLSVFVTLASVSFHFEDRVGIVPPFYSFITFGRYPIPIFNPAIQFILKWVVPFGFVAFYPATHFLDKKGFSFFCYLTPVVAIVSFTVCCVMWNFGTRAYSSTGN